MKKEYHPPVVLVESFRPQDYLCACAVTNPNLSESQQCGFILPDLGIGDMNVTIFAQGWTDCFMQAGSSGSFYGYCYQTSENNLFSS